MERLDYVFVEWKIGMNGRLAIEVSFISRKSNVVLSVGCLVKRKVYIYFLVIKGLYIYIYIYERINNNNKREPDSLRAALWTLRWPSCKLITLVCHVTTANRAEAHHFTDNNKKPTKENPAPKAQISPLGRQPTPLTTGQLWEVVSSILRGRAELSTYIQQLYRHFNIQSLTLSVTRTWKVIGLSMYATGLLGSLLPVLHPGDTKVTLYQCVLNGDYITLLPHCESRLMIRYPHWVTLFQ